MNTPELDGNEQDPSGFDGMLPVEFPRMPSQPTRPNSTDSGSSILSSADSDCSILGGIDSSYTSGQDGLGTSTNTTLSKLSREQEQ